MSELIQECKEYIVQGGEAIIKRRGCRRGLSEIKVSEFELYMLENQDVSFNELLFMMIDKSNQKDSDVYKKARIDRRLFSKIRSSKKYRPSKKTVLSLCLALELSLDDATLLLASAGDSLSRSEEYDLAITFCLIKKIYDFNDINDLLYELGFEVF